MLNSERSENPEQPLPAGQILQVLGLYSPLYSPASHEDAHFLGGRAGFSGAWIWKLETAVGPLCLRAWPQGAMPRERLAGLHRLLAHVDHSGVAGTPVPLVGRHGTTFVIGSDRFWQLEPWMPGTADFAARPSAIRAQAVMQRLSEWHHAAASFIPDMAEQAWFRSASESPSPGIAQRLEHLRRWTAPRLNQVRLDLEQMGASEVREIGLRMLQQFPALAPAVYRSLSEAARLGVRLQPCLRDIWNDHILFTGDEVTGLIDAGSCRTENVAADLARLLGSLFGDDHERRESALCAYRQFHPFSAEEVRLLHAFDQSEVLLSGLNWLEWLILDRRRFPDPARVLARMRQILRRQERLSQTISPLL